MLARLICCVAVSVLVWGCRANVSSKSQKWPPCSGVESRGYGKAFATDTDSALKGRLLAALAIDEASMREEAVVTVALDAAQAGNVEALRAILPHIQSAETLEDLRGNCAINLAGAGKFEEAIQMAKMLKDADDRNKTLKKIATLN